MSVRPGDWTAVELDTVRAMLIKGRSSSEIAQALPNRSRNAVIGKITRMKGALGRLVPKPGPRSKRTKTTDAPAGPRRKRVEVTGNGIGTPAPAVLPSAAPIPTDHALTLPPTTFLDAVTRDRCLYFVDAWSDPAGPDMPVCGAERAQAPAHTRYCRRHLVAQARAA